jgi:hypothetical protein
MAAKKKKSSTKKTSSRSRAATKPKTKAKAASKPKVAAKPKAAVKKAKAKAKAAPKPKAAAKAKVSVGKADKSAVSRRDGSGHLNKAYAADLRAKSRESAGVRDDGRAFLRTSRSSDGLAEELGEEAVAAMNSGEGQGDRMTDLEVEEERGGPFVTTSAAREFASGSDRSNPRTGTREPFPTT